MVGSASGPGSTFKAFLGSARIRVPLSNKIRVRVGSVQHIYGSLRVRVRILGPVKTSSLDSLWEIKIYGTAFGLNLYLYPSPPVSSFGSCGHHFSILFSQLCCGKNSNR